MFRLEKQFRFEASHQLPNHDGKCARLHGHSWIGRLVVEGEELQTLKTKEGMLIDYGDLKKVIDPIVEEYLDHHHLNESLEMASPTSEKIAQWIFYRVKPQLPMLVAVVIEETCTSRCEFRPQ